ncbi:hypothetical protein M0R45_018199 [Rubus argutus]|uniref:Uncharacterized protein n=1 Tax=Rubus argutus TaxID=59490 RepID=A0AAW1X3F0_RUBAR
MYLQGWKVPEKDFRLIDAASATQNVGQGHCWRPPPNVGGDVAQAVAPPRKRGRPQGSRDTHPRKRAAKAHDPSSLILKIRPMKTFRIMVMSKRHLWRTLHR